MKRRRTWLDDVHDKVADIIANPKPTMQDIINNTPVGQKAVDKAVRMSMADQQR